MRFQIQICPVLRKRLLKFQVEKSAESYPIAKQFHTKRLIFPFAFASDPGLSAARKGGKRGHHEDRVGERESALCLFQGKSPNTLIKQTKQKLNKGSRRVRAKEFRLRMESPPRQKRPRSLVGSQSVSSLGAQAFRGIDWKGPGSPTLSLFSLV